MQRQVTSRIVLNVTETADLVFAVAVSGHYAPNHERFLPTLDGEPLSQREFFDSHGSRLYRVASAPGELVVEYSALVLGWGDTAIGRESDLLMYTRPSRYAQSDAFGATAAAEFAGVTDADELVDAVAEWVSARMDFLPGATRRSLGARQAHLARVGVSRDHAHLVVALLRARGVPARVVSTYAPGLDPMSFHTVAEAWTGEIWRVVDTTGRAPQSTLVRIATGRDSADTTFLTVVTGTAEVAAVEVTATTDAPAPLAPDAQLR